MIFEIIVPYKISDEFGYYKKIGETDDPNFARQYTIFDELGVQNYKYIDGEVVERTDDVHYIKYGNMARLFLPIERMR